MTESTVTLSTQEMETVKLIVEGVREALKAQIEGLKEVSQNNDTKVCEKINEIKINFTQHDKRISKLEISLAYQNRQNRFTEIFTMLKKKEKKKE